MESAEISDITNFVQVAEDLQFNVDEALKYFGDQGYKMLSKANALKLSKDDVIEIIIFNEDAGKAVYQLVSMVISPPNNFDHTHNEENTNEVWLGDLHVFFEPEGYQGNQDYDNGINGMDVWEIEIDDIGTDNSHVFFWKPRGTKMDHAEYFL